MFEVKYPDDIAVAYRYELDQHLLEDAKFGLGLSIREAHEMVSRLIRDGLKLIVEDVGYSGLLDVPDPNVVNLTEAKSVCARHIKTCQMLLECEVDRAELVLRNSIKWCEFWSVRAPTAELREMFAKSLRRLVEGPTAMENEDGEKN
ncbi:MAG: hypothetical protein C5B60_02030 [Chloroflexi bacterium]|nr:MAG: hypothetical protein C5B60_02030 [Chloroflexota bacterium]